MNTTDWNDFQDLEHLNKCYQDFLAKEYTNSIHSSLGETPKNRFLKDSDFIKFLPEEELRERFLHRITRKVTATATISLYNIQYEVPQHYIGTTIAIRYHCEDMEEIYIYGGNPVKRLHRCFPVQKVDNANRQRRTNVNYGQMDGGTMDV